MSEAPVRGVDAGERPHPPATGDTAVDEALNGLADLDSAPVHAHHDQLARAHEALQAALEEGSGRYTATNPL
ncbi:MAG TPA: hypothetical protein VNT27_09565 [Propionibacteriaceae bacterium]|nr:hypothetical protein [Propionibacteriaceae bacterium]